MLKKIIVIISVSLSLLSLTSCGKNKTFVVEFNTNGGSEIPSQIVKYNKAAIEPAEPLKPGYVFAGWEYNGCSYGFSTGVKKNLVLDAVWKEKICKVVIKTSRVKTIYVKYNETIEDEEFDIPYGYTDMELQLNGKTFDLSTPITQNITLYPIYTPAIFNVTFNTGCDVDIPKQEISYLKTAIKPEDPVKEGYKFIGWKYNKTVFDFNQKITKNTELSAMWEPNQYKVKYMVDGIMTSYEIVSHNSRIKTPNIIPHKEGYTFVGWQLDGELYDFNNLVTSDMILHAKYELTKYLITFNTNYGSTIEEQIVERGSTIDVPETPVREKHIFYGWYKDSALTEEFDFDTKIEQDMTLYAKWIFVSDAASEASVKSAMNSYKLYKDGSFAEYANSLKDFVKNTKASRYSNYIIEFSNIDDCFGTSYPDGLYCADANQDYTFEVKLIYTYQPKNYSKPVLTLEFILDTDLYVFDYLWCDTQNYNDGVTINEGMLTFTVTGNYVISLYLKAEFTNYVDINCEDVQAFENSDNYMATYRLMNEEECPYIGTLYNIVVE